MCTGYTTGKQYDGDDDDDQKNSKRVCSRAYIKVGQRRDFILRDTEGRERGGSGRKVWRKKGRKNKNTVVTFSLVENRVTESPLFSAAECVVSHFIP